MHDWHQLTGLQQEAEQAGRDHGMIDHADGRPSPMTYFKEGFEAAAETRDQRIRRLQREVLRLWELERLRAHSPSQLELGDLGMSEVVRLTPKGGSDD